MFNRSKKYHYSHALLGILLCSLLAGAATGEPSPDPTYKDCLPGDKAAVLAINAAFGSYFSKWWGAPETPCCDWYGVECDPFIAGRVTGFFVFKQDDFYGTIPDAIDGLAHLQRLFLHHLPGLSGPIPPAIGKLSNLSLLIISWTGLSGPVPPFLGAPKKLYHLDLSFNSLTGSIPASLGSIPGLSGINVSRNRLYGAVPMFLSKSADDVYLWLSHNNLTGPVPAEFAAVRFTHLDLSRNAFTGDASGLFGKGQEDLLYVDLSRNAFDFELSGLVFPEKLNSVDMSHNAIRGGVPRNMANVQFFNVSYNRLCGQVPTGASRFGFYSFQHNRCLCGAPLPPCKK
uniref:Polygalacturonase inhibitor n=1 Tax=Brachypodium sylvaticum TaxID=29664 RepID=A1YKE8_BRASY|nr:polygalacturonase inhibitor [Brachypodium sylvaticum]